MTDLVPVAAGPAGAAIILFKFAFAGAADLPRTAGHLVEAGAAAGCQGIQVHTGSFAAGFTSRALNATTPAVPLAVSGISALTVHADLRSLAFPATGAAVAGVIPERFTQEPLQQVSPSLQVVSQDPQWRSSEVRV